MRAILCLNQFPSKVEPKKLIFMKFVLLSSMFSFSINCFLFVNIPVIYLYRTDSSDVATRSMHTHAVLDGNLMPHLLLYMVSMLYTLSFLYLFPLESKINNISAMKPQSNIDKTTIDFNCLPWHFPKHWLSELGWNNGRSCCSSFSSLTFPSIQKCLGVASNNLK